MLFKGADTYGTAGLVGTSYHNNGVIHSWQTVITGTPTSFHAAYEGSLDGTNFVQLDNYVGTVSTMRPVVDQQTRWARSRVGTMGGGDNAVAVITWMSRVEAEYDRLVFNKR